MTNLIASDTQGQEITSGLVELFELTTSAGTFYFHPGLKEDFTSIQFRDRESPNTARTYIAIPMILDGVEVSSAGAPNRPNLTIANVTSDLKTAVGITEYDELSGATLVRRQTLEKYLVGGSDPDQSNPPIELNTVKYKIDRISGLTNITVTFELSVVYDLEGIQLPRRVVVGKFCSWMYQGHELKSSGGCVWDKDGDFQTVDASDSSVTHKLFFDLDDTPLILTSLLQSTASAWSAGQSYTQSSYVIDIGIYYRCEIAHTSANSTRPALNTGEWLKVRPYTVYSSSTNYVAGNLVQATTTHFGKTIETVWKALASSTGKTPSVDSSYWQREELCGKKLSSCKCRFQARMVNNNASSLPQSSKNTSGTLPFGAFPGTNRF